MSQKTKKIVMNATGLIVAISAVTYFWITNGLKPTPMGREVTIYVPRRTSAPTLMSQLEEKGIIKNSNALSLYAIVTKRLFYIGAGTYKLHPGMKAGQIIGVLRKPFKQLVRIPDGWWIQRAANLLEEKGVCKANDYILMSQHPEQFQSYVSFKLPETGSLEGYLFPDTYDLPPHSGAYTVICKQLKAFEKKVLPKIPKNEDIHKILTIASMVELEAESNEERAKIVGVINNRLKKNMRLQFCSTALYGIQEWRPLKPGETDRIKSPYNTYCVKGLPPGPICSPTLESIGAALKPIQHSYLFFVAKPEGGHTFSENFQQHKSGINLRKRGLLHTN